MGDAGYPRLWIAASGTVLLAVTEERGKIFEQSCYVKLKLMSKYLRKDFNSNRICWSREILLCVARIKI